MATRVSRKSGKRPNPPKDPLAGERAHELAMAGKENTRLGIKFAGGFVLLLGLSVAFLALYPTAKVLSGKETALTVSVTLIGTLGITGVAGVIQFISAARKRRIKRLEARNDTLRETVHELRSRLKKAKLDADVSRAAQIELEES